MKKAGVFLVVAIAIYFSGCSKEPTTFEELFKAGETAYVKEQFPQARNYLSKAIALQTSNKRALYLLGVSYGRDFLLDSAFLYLKRADLLNPNDREINLALYKIAPELKEWQAAITAIAVLTKTGDAQEKYYQELARYSAADSNYASAYYYQKKMMAVDPENQTRYLELASMAHLVELTDTAIAIMDTAIAKFGPKEEFLSNKGVFMIFKGDFTGAEAIFRNLANSSVSNKLFYQLNLANSLASQPQRSKKEEALKLYLTLRDKSSQTLRIDTLITQLKAELGRK
jgi:Flp pilus assembly protein TadD